MRHRGVMPIFDQHTRLLNGWMRLEPSPPKHMLAKERPVPLAVRGAMDGHKTAPVQQVSCHGRLARIIEHIARRL
jgi:hypothetical protein